MRRTVADQAPSTLDNISTIVEMFGSAVTALAIIVGGVWTYFNFVKGRTYRPRLESELEAQWLDEADGSRLLHIRVGVHNIGASVVDLVQRGSGLRISSLDATRVDHQAPVWLERATREVLTEHAWIEPNEKVSDDLIVALGPDAPSTCMLEMRLVWSRSPSAENVVHFSRRITTGESVLNGIPVKEDG
jgi:hypothetical protein